MGVIFLFITITLEAFLLFKTASYLHVTSARTADSPDSYMSPETRPWRCLFCSLFGCPISFSSAPSPLGAGRPKTLSARCSPRYHMQLFGNASSSCLHLLDDLDALGPWMMSQILDVKRDITEGKAGFVPKRK
ncbi:hypothetical protein FZEAL_97 [Fusarium zealandicum]|uniref:Uncharacterized protein n=1 Tax=Fusarium zealandicum TaxID=1053134 RepID=A0A8H4UVY0_9HYPO|nr:hypothetical protein FZEAL_97 [Fusarium zealandicum]